MINYSHQWEGRRPQLNYFTLQSLAMQLSALILIKSWCKKSQLPCCRSGVPAYFNLFYSFSHFTRCNSSHLFLSGLIRSKQITGSLRESGKHQSHWLLCGTAHILMHYDGDLFITSNAATTKGILLQKPMFH